MYQKAKFTFNGQWWEPTMITPDYSQLAEAGERMMLRFHRDKEPEFFIAPQGEMRAGWVVGKPL